MQAANGAFPEAKVASVIPTPREAADGDLRLEFGVLQVAAMVRLGAVCLAVATLDSQGASANSVDKATSEVAVPAADWEAGLVVPGALAGKVKDRAAVPHLVVTMEALVLVHLSAARTVFPTLDNTVSSQD